jgi:S-adenosylmethionine hydrolase
MPPGILTLTTDFGLRGSYVAEMKGVVLAQAPGTQLIDVTHSITPQSVVEGSFVLSGIVDAFPGGTVHLAVVDPGVGTDRRLIAARIAEHWFVLPDNGLLTAVARGRRVEEIREISDRSPRRTVVSSTFHGRDILAPAAAHLLLGRDPAELGPVRESFVVLENFEARRDDAGFVGEVIYRDSFGNLITNITAAQLGNALAERWVVEIAGQTVAGLSRTYGDNAADSLIALVGSQGWLEVAIVNGSAAEALGAGIGTVVALRRRDLI